MDVDRLTYKQKRGALRFALSAMLLFACAAQPRARAAQETNPRQPAKTTAQEESAPGNRIDWMRQLSLTPEQVAQIRQIRRQAETEGRALGRRLNEARRTLDEAIYAEAADDALIEERTREVAQSQAALMRLRASTELRVRRVLTPEQLNVFRQLRRQAQSRQRLRRQERRDARQQRQRQRRPAPEAFNEEMPRRPAAAPQPDNNKLPTRRPSLFQRARRRGVRQ